ncbi:Rpn family recombination-promoting nuclease/putative transposase [Cohnella soli]|uniref:Rpn family recombination-promoting nuclease/putative transposase n=1 Tax=Cohnella soli TaxID=425005 RepID=A0ABW0HSG7_9BACL
MTRKLYSIFYAKSTDILEIHFIECPKFQHVVFDINDPLHHWLRFLDQHTTTEQMEELMRMDETIKEAEARLSYLASDEETRRLYAIREKALHDRASWLEDAEAEGREKGRVEGTAETLKLTALRMLQKGLPIATISEVTGLDEKEIESLDHSNSK